MESGRTCKEIDDIWHLAAITESIEAKRNHTDSVSSTAAVVGDNLHILSDCMLIRRRIDFLVRLSDSGVRQDCQALYPRLSKHTNFNAIEMYDFFHPEIPDDSF